MLNMKNGLFSVPDDQMNGEQFKVITFALTLWLTTFILLFVLSPVVYGAVATKPKLFRAFAMMSLPLMFGAGLAGLRSKSKSLSSLVLQGFVLGLMTACLASFLVLIVD